MATTGSFGYHLLHFKKEESREGKCSFQQTEKNIGAVSIVTTRGTTCLKNNGTDWENAFNYNIKSELRSSNDLQDNNKKRIITEENVSCISLNAKERALKCSREYFSRCQSSPRKEGVFEANEDKTLEKSPKRAGKRYQLRKKVFRGVWGYIFVVIYFVFEFYVQIVASKSVKLRHAGSENKNGNRFIQYSINNMQSNIYDSEDTDKKLQFEFDEELKKNFMSETLKSDILSNNILSGRLKYKVKNDGIFDNDEYFSFMSPSKRNIDPDIYSLKYGREHAHYDHGFKKQHFHSLNSDHLHKPSNPSKSESVVFLYNPSIENKTNSVFVLSNSTTKDLYTSGTSYLSPQPQSIEDFQNLMLQNKNRSQKFFKPGKKQKILKSPKERHRVSKKIRQNKARRKRTESGTNVVQQNNGEVSMKTEKHQDLVDKFQAIKNKDEIHLSLGKDESVVAKETNDKDRLEFYQQHNDEKLQYKSIMNSESRVLETENATFETPYESILEHKLNESSSTNAESKDYTAGIKSTDSIATKTLNYTKSSMTSRNNAATPDVMSTRTPKKNLHNEALHSETAFKEGQDRLEQEKHEHNFLMDTDDFSNNQHDEEKQKQSSPHERKSSKSLRVIADHQPDKVRHPYSLSHAQKLAKSFNEFSGHLPSVARTLGRKSPMISKSSATSSNVMSEKGHAHTKKVLGSTDDTEGYVPDKEDTQARKSSKDSDDSTDYQSDEGRHIYSTPLTSKVELRNGLYYGLRVVVTERVAVEHCRDVVEGLKVRRFQNFAVCWL